MGIVLLSGKGARDFTKLFLGYFNFFTSISYADRGHSFSYYIYVKGF